jgi:putative hydrolase of the HAD superfamily
MNACLLDFGGTLDSDGGHWLDRFFDLYDRAGLAIDKPRLKEAFYKADDACRGAGHRTFKELLLFHAARQVEALGLPAHYAESLARGFYEPSYVTLRRNAALLQRLKKRFVLGIVSNWYGNLREICAEVGLEPSLTAIIDSAVVGKAKPDPEIFRLALKSVGTPAGHACFVGDNFERDMAPAKALGMRTIWINAGRPPRPGVVDVQISSLNELEEAIAS